MDIREKCKAADDVNRLLTETIKELTECHESQISIIERKIEKWPFFRTAFSVWAQVLARFDSIMDAMSNKYDLENFQSVPFSEKDKKLLISVLRILITIWDNSYDRNSQNFLSHMKVYLCTTDLDVLYESLRLKFRALRRFRSQRSNRAFNLTLLSQLKEIASRWQIQEDQIDIPQLCKDDTIIPQKNKSLNFWFYKVPQKANAHTNIYKSLGITPLNLHEHFTSKTSLSTKLAKDDILQPVADGPILIHVPEADISSKSIKEIMSHLIPQYDISNNFKYSLFWKLIVTSHINDPVSRRKLISIKFLAVGLIFIAYGSESLKPELFVYEPNLITNISDLLKINEPTYENIEDIQSLRLSALTALCCFFHHRGKIFEVLASVNAWAYHGTLASLFRNVINSLALNDHQYSHELVNEIFGLVFLLKSSYVTGDPIVSGGYIQTLVKHIENTNVEHYGSISRAIVTLDSFISLSPNVIEVFVPTKGFNTIVKRISEEVDWFVSKSQNEMNCDDSTGGSAFGVIIVARITLLRSLLKFALSLMQNTAFSENIRSLIDTTLPHSILSILEHSSLFTSGMQFLAMNIMSTFVHNDPTCLTVLQEMKISQTFLSLLLEKIPVSSEIISSLPGVFGTICLNQAGLDYFTSNIEILNKFISTLSSEEYIDIYDDGDFAYTIGEHIDEFIRHNPSLKESLCESVVLLLKQIFLNCQTPHPNDPLNYRLHLPSDYSPNSSFPPDNEKHSFSMRYLNVVSRFLEGFFYESVLPYESLADRADIVSIILDCYMSSSIPYNIASFSTASSFTYTFKFINSTNYSRTAVPIAEGINKLIDDIKHLVIKRADSHPISKVCIDLSSASEEQISNAQKTLRCFIRLGIYINLFLSMISNHHMRNGNGSTFIVQFMNQEGNEPKISTLSTVNSIIMCERIKIINSIPNDWLEKCMKSISKDKNKEIPAKAPSNIFVDIFGTIPNFIFYSGNIYSILKKSRGFFEGNEEYDNPNFKHKFKNATMFLYLFAHVPVMTIALFESVLKFSTLRKHHDDETKSSVLNFINEIAQYFCDQLTFSKFGEGDEKLKLQYLSSVISCLAMSLFDAREESIQLTSLAPIFTERGGVKILASLLASMWDTYVKTGTSENRDEQFWLFINSTISLLLNLLIFITSIEYVKPVKLSRLYGDTQDSASQGFDAKDYISRVMIDLSEPLLNIWRSSHFMTLTTPLVQFLIIKIVINVVVNLNHKPSPMLHPRQISWNLQMSPDSYHLLRNRSSPVVPDETKIQQLTEMGFSREASSTALFRCNNDVGSAAEYLITHHIPSETESSTMNSQLEGAAVFPSTLEESVFELTSEEQQQNRMENSSAEPQLSTSETSIQNKSDSNTNNKSRKNGNVAQPGGYNPSQAVIAKAKISEEFTENKIQIAVEILKYKPSLFNQIFSYIKFSTPDNNMHGPIEELEKYAADSLSLIDENLLPKNEAYIFSLWNILALSLKVSIGFKNKIPIAEEFIIKVYENLERVARCSSRILCHMILVLDMYSNYYDRISNLYPEEYPQTVLESVRNSVLSDRPSFMKLLLNVFPLCVTNADTYNAALISILRLADDHELVKTLPKTDFFSIIFNTKTFAMFPSQMDLLMLLIRRIMEDRFNLKVSTILELERSTFYFHTNQERQFLRNFIRTHLCYVRNLDIFCDVMLKLFKISFSPPNSFNNKQHSFVSLNRPTDQTKSDTSQESKTQSDDHDGYSKKYMSFLERYHSLSDDNMKLEAIYDKSKTEHCEILLDLLINELFSCDLEFNQKINAETQLGTSLELHKSEANSGNPQSKPDSDVQAFYENMLSCIKGRCILQMITEILISYPHISIYLLPNLIKKAAKNVTIQKPSSQCKITSLINFLINMFIGDWVNIPRARNDYYAFLQNKKLICGDAAASLLVYLVKFGEIWEPLQNYCLQYIISGYSIEVLVKALKNAMSLPDLTTDALFSIYTFICQLARDLTAGCPNFRFRPISMGISSYPSMKELIDKGFVSCVTQVIKDIDIHNPRTKSILPFAIESLRSFTVAAIEYGEIIEPTAFENDKEGLDSLIKAEGDSDIYNAYNNSSLQIYGYSQSGSDEVQDEECSDVETLNSAENEDYLSNGSNSSNGSENNDNDQPYGMSVNYGDMDVNLIVSQHRRDEMDDISEADMDDNEEDEEEEADDDADDGVDEETEDDLEDEVGDEDADQEGIEGGNAASVYENISLNPRGNTINEYAIDDAIIWENSSEYEEEDSRRQFPIFRTIGLRYNSRSGRGNHRSRNYDPADNYSEINIADDDGVSHSRDFDDVTRVALGLNTNTDNVTANVAHIDVGLPLQTRIYRLDHRRDRRHMGPLLGNHLMEIINMSNDGNIEYNFLESGDASNGMPTAEVVGSRYSLPITRSVAANGIPDSFVHPLLRKCFSERIGFALPTWVCAQSDQNNNFDQVTKSLFDVPCTMHFEGNEFGYPIWLNMVGFTDIEDLMSTWDNNIGSIESHLAYRTRLREKSHKSIVVHDPENIPIVDRIVALRNFKILSTSDRWFQDLFFKYSNSLIYRCIQVEKILLEHNKNTNCKGGTQEGDNDTGDEADKDLSSSEPERKRPKHDNLPEVNSTNVISTPGNERQVQNNDEQLFSNEDGIFTINGSRIDFSRHNIDVEFLSALPHNLRQEMLTQYMDEVSRTTRHDDDSSDNLFNDPPAFPALPIVIRNRQLLHRANNFNAQNHTSRNSISSTTNQSNSRNNHDSYNNINNSARGSNSTYRPRTPNQDIRVSRDTYNTSNDAASPMEIDSSFNPYTKQTDIDVKDQPSTSSQKHHISSKINSSTEINVPSGSLTYELSQFPSETEQYLKHRKKILEIRNNINANREAINVLDKVSVAALLRLLFLPEPIAKGDLHSTLVNACENSTTNRDILLIILTILFEEINNFQAVEKMLWNIISKHHNKASFSQLRRHNSKIQSVPAQYAENIPNLILRRCLDVLVSLLSNNKVLEFFFTEDENFVNKILQNSKKCNRVKGVKSNSSILRRPVILLFKILERPLFLSNAALTELIMFILVSILQPITLLKNVNKNSKLVQKPSSDENNDETRGTQGPSNEGNDSAEGYLQDISELCLGSQVIDSTNPSSFTDSNISLPRLDTRNISGKEYHKTFDFPSHYINLISNVLVNDVCSRKTFQCTISLIHTICLICKNKNHVISSLISVVQSLADSLVSQLESLNNKLKEFNDISDIGDRTFNKFASPSSDQAKLLRVLKTADFIHYKTSSIISQTSSDKNGSQNDLKNGDALEHNGNSPEYDLIISYKELKLSKLWNVFSELLTTIGSFENLTNAATVLLPLIESFMIIMKPYVLCKQLCPENDDGIVASLNNRELFFNFTEEHKRILNAMIWNNSSLMNGSFSLLIQNIKILDFENKCYYFHQQLHKRSNVDSTTLQMNVRRKYIFEDSYHQMRGYSGEEIKYGTICVSFYKEDGVDAGGLSREWFSALARQMFNPDYALFRPSANDKVTYQPNRLSYVNSDHLMYFKFVGTIIGKAIFDKHLLDAYFTRSFYKAMIDSPVDIKDMEAVDPEFYKSLEWILNNDITDVLDLTFCTEIDEFGKKKIIELVPKGSQVPVTEENKHQYVKLIVEQHLHLNIKTQIDSFMSGFYEIIPKELLKIFNEQELELLISGLPDIDIDDWKNNTEYHNYTSSSTQIIWFWRTVRSFTQEERAKLLQFCTGTSKVPLEGFQGFQIHRDFSSINRLPSAHTCFNQLDLPAYESYEILRKYLILAISEGNSGFGFA